MNQNGGHPPRFGRVKRVFRALARHFFLVGQRDLQGQGAADGGVAQVGVQVAELLHLSLFGPGKPEHNDCGPGGGRCLKRKLMSLRVMVKSWVNLLTHGF